MTVPLIQLFTLYTSQSLTTLNLIDNQIGHLGTHHLANALEHNYVSKS